jgi:hypothetical protein
MPFLRDAAVVKEDEVSMMQPETIRNRLTTVIAIILVVAALHWSYPVTMPLMVAVFIIAAAWPIKPWLEQMLPSSLSYFGTVPTLFLILSGFIAVIYFAVVQVAQTFEQNHEQFRGLYESYAIWWRNKGLPVLGSEGGYDRLVALAQALLRVKRESVPLVPWKRDSYVKSRSAAPGSQGATTENIGHIRARSNAARRDAPPGN